MASRMDRYKTYSDNPKRTDSKRSIYEQMYEGKEYSNVEGVVEIEKDETIDIDKLRELLKKREFEKNNQIIKPIVREVERPTLKEEIKNYDLKELLDKAKVGRTEDLKKRSINNTGYDILKSISVKNVDNMNEEESKEHLKDLINTITKTSALNKLNDKELSLSLLDELKGSDKTLSNNELINKIINEPAYHEEVKEEMEVDKSFFTSGYNFDATDFENLKDIQNSLKKNKKLLKGTLVTLGIVLVIAILVVIYVLVIK